MYNWLLAIANQIRMKILQESYSPYIVFKMKSAAQGLLTQRCLYHHYRARAEVEGKKVARRSSLEEMESALHQLRGIGQLIGDQLDESEAQIDRIGVKMERDDIKMKDNRAMRQELR